MNTKAYNITSNKFQARRSINKPLFKNMNTKTAKLHKNIFFLGFGIYLYVLFFHFSGNMYQ